MKLGSITRLARDVEYTTDKEVFKIRLLMMNEPVESIDILWKVYKLITMTDYAPKRIRDIIKKDSRYADVAEDYGITEGTLKRQVYEFTSELSRIWGGLDIIEIFRGDYSKVDKDKLRNIEAIIEDSLRNSELLIESIEDKFSVDIISDANINQNFKDIDRDEFIMIRNKLVSFSIPSQKFILKNTDKRSISYGVYLIVTPEDKLSEEDRSRKKELESFTKIRQGE